MHAMKLQGSAILFLLGLMCAASQEASPGRNPTPPQIQTEEKTPDQT
jgi:hypothetical protein